MNAKLFNKISWVLLVVLCLSAVSSIALERYAHALLSSLAGLMLWFIHLPLFERMKTLEEEEEEKERKAKELEDWIRRGSTKPEELRDKSKEEENE